MKNIRQLLEEYLDYNGITKASVAKKLGMSQQNFQSKISKNHFSTEFVILLCKELKHDFFLDLSKELNSESIDLLEILSIPTKPLTQEENEAYLLDKMNRMLDKKLIEVTNNMINKNEVRLVINDLRDEIVEIKEHFALKETSLKKSNVSYNEPVTPVQFSVNEKESNYEKKK